MLRITALSAGVILALTGMNLLLAQSSERGTISGTVKDPSGAMIPSAKITVTNPATNFAATAVTTETGDYAVPALTPGQYNVRVDKDGFKPAIISNVTVNTSTNTSVAVTLEVGTATQAIEVQATALTLHTEDAKASTTITNKLVDELPLVVGGALRSPFDLAQLTPESKRLTNLRAQLSGFVLKQTFNEGTSEPFIARLMASMIELRDKVIENVQERQAFEAAYSPVLDNLLEARRLYRQSCGPPESGGALTGAAVADASFDTVANTALLSTLGIFKSFNLSADSLLEPDAGFNEGVASLYAHDPILATYI